MANNNISWLGNPVVDEGSSRKTSYSPMYYNSSTRQDPPAVPPMQTQDTTPLTEQGPPLVTDVGYIPYYLDKNIGKNVRAEFVIGTQYVDKTGKLIEVGINYFVLDDINSRTHIMCDLYSVKFVTILNQ